MSAVTDEEQTRRESGGHGGRDERREKERAPARRARGGPGSWGLHARRML